MVKITKEQEKELRKCIANTFEFCGSTSVAAEVFCKENNIIFDDSIEKIRFNEIISISRQ